MNKFLFGNLKHLTETLNNGETPVFELLVGQMITMAVKHGDFQRLNFLMDRIIGKCPDIANVNLTGIPEWVISLYQMSPEQRRKRYEAMKKKRRKKK